MITFTDTIFPYLTGMAEGLILFYFYGKLVGRKGRISHTVFFLLLVCLLINLPFTTVPKLLLITGSLFLYGLLVLKAGSSTSLLYALLTVEVMVLSFGIFNSLSFILAFFLYQANPAVFGLICMTAGCFLALSLSCLCYRLIQKQLNAGGEAQHQIVLIMILPLLLIFLVSEAINDTVYGNTVSFSLAAKPPVMEHVQLLFLQLLGMVSIFSILYAYRKLSDSFSLRMKLSVLEQQTHDQLQYVTEARAHYESTKSLRHDMKNHLLIVKGLLDNDNADKASAYLSEMDILTDSLSFPYQTGNPVLDILIENKAALACSRGIEFDCSLKIPSPCMVSDVDFCIILANTLDNAISACGNCRAEPMKKYIRITSRTMGDFYQIEVENSFAGNPDIKQGTGLSNIKLVAEKYDGSMNITTSNQRFCIRILLVISQHP